MLAFLLAPALAAPSNIFVAPHGKDSNPGSGALPLKTPAKALEKAGPGTTIHLAAGRYPLSTPLVIPRSGSDGRWITVQGPVEGEAVLDGSPWMPKEGRDAYDRGLIDIAGQSYLRLRRLAVVSSRGFGIYARDKSRFIDIQDCRVSRTFGPGIGIWNSEDVRIVGNEVTLANVQTQRVFGSREHECPHEAVSIAGVNRFEAAWNRVHHCQKEGIDVKEVSRNGVVHHNYVYELDRQGLYVDAWFGLLENVAFHSNVVHNCEWGMIVSAEGNGAELRGVQVVNNLITDNRASGFYLGTWGNDGPRRGVLVEHNTFWRNGSPSHWAGATGNIDVRARNIRGLSIRRNIALLGGAFDIATFAQNPDKELAEQDIVIEDNFQGPLRVVEKSEAHAAHYGKPVSLMGKSPVVGEIEFEGEEFGDFTFAPESPSKPVGHGAWSTQARAAAARFKSPLGPQFPPYSPSPRGLPPVLADARSLYRRMSGEP